MLELMLMGSVPAVRHQQLIQVLAGVAAMAPVSMLEKHDVLKPSRDRSDATPSSNAVGQNIPKQAKKDVSHDLYYLHLVGTRDHIKTDRHDQAGSNKLDDFAWTLQFRDLPDVVRQRPVTSYGMLEVPIVVGDPAAFTAAMDYTYGFQLLESCLRFRSVSKYCLIGQRFTYKNTCIFLHRIHVLSGADAEDVQNAPLLDSSGTYILQTTVRVLDGANVELVNRGMTELLQLKETLQSIVSLDIADRLAMDPRVR